MVMKCEVFSNNLVLKEDLLPVMTLALSHATPMILDKGIFSILKLLRMRQRF